MKILLNVQSKITVFLASLLAVAEFDKYGRPYHYLFYTGKPNYYDLMHVRIASAVSGTLYFI